MDDHPARKASKASMDAVERKAREEWLSLFAEDAIVEDPVGVSALDPEGKGHRGRREIAAFWDANIGPHTIRFNIWHSYAAGLEAANTGTVTSVMGNGATVTIEGTFVYRVNEDGKILSLRAFWEADKVQLGRL